MPRWGAKPVQAILFDLDGTLVDTAADITLALNRTLDGLGLEPMAEHAVRVLIGRGAAVLIGKAMNAHGRIADAAQVDALLRQFIGHYAELLEQGESRAVPFPGALAALRLLRAGGVRLAVVTNKAKRLAESTLLHAGFGAELALVVGGDSCARRKPDPEPLLFACQQLGVAPVAALMVGDSVNDVLAARAAGMPVLCVPYGYNEGADPHTLDCDGFAESLADLPALLGA